ncbi:hypothetical protein BDB01DRAFT_769099 [Pilobolus umbonatus]|nr:hypothetical protein BDB01DRAFT_769099 [Pilobolus umbonatus]
MATSTERHMDNYLVGFDFGAITTSAVIYDRKNSEIIPVGSWPSIIGYKRDENNGFVSPNISAEGNMEFEPMIERFSNLRAYAEGKMNPKQDIQGLTPKQMLSDFFKLIHISVKDKYEDADSPDVCYCLASPDTHTQAYQDFMCDVFVTAGILNRKEVSERLTFVNVSKAAAYYCLFSKGIGHQFSMDKKYLVCEAGYSALSIASLKFQSSLSNHQVESEEIQNAQELSSAQLDRNMREYLEVCLAGRENIDLAIEMLLQFFSEEFKPMYKGEEDLDIYEILDSRGFDMSNDDRDALNLPGNVVWKKIYEPVVTKTVNTIVKCADSKGIENVFLCGAFGSSNVFFDHLNKGNVVPVDTSPHMVSSGAAYYVDKCDIADCPFRPLLAESIKSEPYEQKKAKKSSKNEVVDVYVGIDFGTTFSGCSYIIGSAEKKDGSKSPQVNVVDKWPDFTGTTSHKTPTALMFKISDDSTTLKLWGQKAKNKKAVKNEFLVEKFKLLLTPDDEVAKHKSFPVNEKDKGKDKQPQRLSRWTPIQLVSFYLKAFNEFVLKKHIMKSKELKGKTPNFTYCLTVPAMWDEKAKSTTKEAALLAGLVPRDKKDNLYLISEPAAAALYCDHSFKEFDLNPGTKFMVVDAGGGTVDIISFEVIQSDSDNDKNNEDNVALKELCQGDGGKCGSTYLDARFRDYLVKIFNENGVKSSDDDYKKIVDHFIDNGKKSFRRGRTNAPVKIPLPSGVSATKKPPFLKDGYITFTYEEIDEEVFKPIIDQITKLINDQFDKLEEAVGSKDINSILLVGGFGQSDYLRSALKERFPGRHIPVPPQGVSAISRGAVSFAYKPRMVTEKVARKTYSMEVCNVAKREDQARGFETIEYRGRKYSKYVNEPIIKKTASIIPGMKFKMPVVVPYPNKARFGNIFDANANRKDSTY